MREAFVNFAGTPVVLGSPANNKRLLRNKEDAEYYYYDCHRVIKHKMNSYFYLFTGSKFIAPILAQVLLSVKG